MMKRTTLYLCAAGAPLALLCGLTATRSQASDGPDRETFPDPTGQIRTLSTQGDIDTQNPFFQSLGTNGRACVTCHQLSDGLSITPAHIRDRFEDTDGTDPLFRTNDGSNSPNADVSTLEARRKAYSMLLKKGLIRVGIGIPAGAEFTLAAVDDPYHYASANELSLFRRPLPSTNLNFLSGVMWDGRETIQPIKGDRTASSQALFADLMHQANDATLGHAQAAFPLTPDQQRQIASFELTLFTAQSRDREAGRLDAQGARGGPHNLSKQDFYIGINDVLGADPTGAPFNPEAMTLFAPWSDLRSSGADEHTLARESVARGQAIFNTKPINITGVGGLNDALGVPRISGTCTSCHDSPNVGNHSVSLPINIGLADASRRTPDLPLYTLRHKATGQTIQTTDPGRALITGKWSDIGKFKGPILHGLAARAPYFHNGSAATLEEVVVFYDSRFNIGFTLDEKEDLIAFLRSL
jgi:cytochrome c peroxidase